MNNLIDFGLAEHGFMKNLLCNNGLASPNITFYGTIEVWILSSSSPQAPNIVGIWDDSQTWVDTNIWYD